MRRRLRTSQPNQARVAAPRVRRPTGREQRRRVRRVNRQAYQNNYMQNFRNNFQELDWNNLPMFEPGQYDMRGVPRAIFDEPAAGGDLATQFSGMSLRRRRYR